MESLVKKQNALKSIFNTFLKNYDKNDTSKHTLGYLNGRKNGIENIWSDFTANHLEIVEIATDEDISTNDYFNKSVYEKLEETYYLSLGEISDALELVMQNSTKNSPAINNTTVNNSTINSAQSDLKLPTISIPTFSGSYLSWNSFKDLFTALVHEKSSLTNVQKLHYLKCNLSGEAEQILRHLSITDANYDIAWQSLFDRYENKRVLVDAQLTLLLSQPPIIKENSQLLKRLLDTTKECVHSLKNMNIKTDCWDPIIVYITIKKLPQETYQLWESKHEGCKELLTFQQLQEFLEGRFHTLERISEQQKSIAKESPFKQQTAISCKFNNKSFHVTDIFACIICKKSHSVRQCPEFLKLKTPQRHELAKSKGLCFNCLSQRHQTNKCTSTSKCYVCGLKHHTLLHFIKPSNIHTTTQDTSLNLPGTSQMNYMNLAEAKQSSSNVHIYYSSETNSKCILFSTALVNARSASGHVYTLRALIDQGSQASFISEDAVQKLKLKRQPVLTSISGLSSSQPLKSLGLISLSLYPHTDIAQNLQVNLLVISSITSLLPTHTIANQNWNHLTKLPLADPTYWKPGKVDILLGADVYPDILLNGMIKGPPGSPIAQQTTLGWILSGPSKIHSTTGNIITMHSQCDLDLSLRRFWEIEEIKPDRIMSQAELKCEEMYQKTHQRDSKNGTYTVSLPFSDPSGQSKSFGKSRDLAFKRYLYLENKLKGNPLLLEQHNTCLREYLEMGHMEVVTTTELDHVIKTDNDIYYTCSYLPHHGVVKEGSSTTKYRVVFDASCKTSSGKSLNDELLVGPTIQDEMIQILLRWRTHRIAFTADIAKMYRQIKLIKEHADFQRILWRFHPDEQIKEYKLKTVTFGTSLAPFLAIRTLQQLAKDESDKFPIASRVTLRDFYVDDLMSGADTLPEAIELQKQLNNLTIAGGFQLRKWISNCTEAPQGIPISDLECNLPLSIDIDPTIKTLGIIWNPANDSFHFKVNLPPLQGLLTKRRILSDIARLFDPLGWLAPTIITAKIFMQRLWLKGLTWDEEVPGDIMQNWLIYRKELQLLEHIKIPRWISTTRKIPCELHGFCDASQSAYAAVLYLRIIDSIHTNVCLLTSKTRVAPLKEISLPRLELCGAVLLAKLFKKVLRCLDQNIVSMHAWTDSTIVLSWICRQPNRWKSFFANRVTEITSTLNPEIWRHVVSGENPADCASRGISSKALAMNSLWWNGPQWLQKPSTEWPIKTTVDLQQTSEEKRNATFFMQTGKEECTMMSRFSSLNRLIRITAYCYRFVNNSRGPKPKREIEWLKTYELRVALQKLLKCAQSEMYSDEKRRLQGDRLLPSKSRLLSLSPFLDKNELMRVGGRLQEANLKFSERHPVILSSKHHLTKLLIDQAHKVTLHGGAQLMLSFLRRRYWIIDARNALRHHVHKCLKCFRETAQPNKQLMGNLPQPRISITRPFTHVGVDYAGPVDIRVSKGRGNKSYKGYISIFVCLSTKGIHIEAVSDMTSNAFLAAFRRFVSRRGLPSHVYSDCGTNFIGANNQLSKDVRHFKRSDKEIAELLANDGIEWHFIPPASPHFGGLWEAGVKSMKFHMRRILGNTFLTFEELTTVLCQIEACLNSRPLCPITSDPTDLSILTPGHFQMGTAPITPPEVQLLNMKTHSLSRWQLLQKLYQDFWSRWSSEYLSRLQQRPKWATRCPNVQKNELVLIKDERIPACKWLLGRVIETHPGKDGLIRVVTLKTANSVIKRPITKICSLPNSKVEDQ